MVIAIAYPPPPPRPTWSPLLLGLELLARHLTRRFGDFSSSSRCGAKECGDSSGAL